MVLTLPHQRGIAGSTAEAHFLENSPSSPISKYESQMRKRTSQMGKRNKSHLTPGSFENQKIQFSESLSEEFQLNHFRKLKNFKVNQKY
jgi:hypothetical protein